jgi:VWFA-related protein
MRRGLVLSAVAATFALSVRPIAQQQPPTFRGGVDVVQVDVSVLDENRHPIKGLTAADFTVLTDGKPQPVVAFSAVDVPGPDKTSAAWLRETSSDVVANDVNVRRIVVIAMDDAYMPFDPGVRDFAVKIGNAVIDELGPNDLATVTHTFLGKKENLTTNRQHLREAVNAVMPHPNNPFAAAPRFTAEATGHASVVGRGASMGPCDFRGAYGCVVDTLIHAADALASAPPGRKSLFYISTGVPYDFSMHNLELAREIEGLGEMFAALQRANISVYAIDPLGLTPEGITSKRLDSLKMFSETTGGRAILATNTPWVNVPEIFQENSSYYLLGIDNTKADGYFHRLEVKVNRPDATVETRAGYFAPKSEKPDAARAKAAAAAPVDRAIGSATPVSGLPLAMSVAPFAQADLHQALLAVAIGLRRPPDATVPPGEVEVVVSAFDTEWKERATERQLLKVSPPANATSAFEYEALARLHLPPGRYEIRAAAASGDGTGSVFTDLDVPEFNKETLSLSGLVIGMDPPLLGATKNVFADLMPVVPTPVRTISSSAAVTAFIRLYQGGSKPTSPVRVNAAIVDDDDATRVTQTTPLDAAAFSQKRFADYAWKLPIDRLGPGNYLVRIEATLGSSTITRTARIAITK